MLIASPRDLGQAIRRDRRGRGWSQSRLAQVATVSRQWVVALEGGKTSVELGAVLRTLAALDLAVDLVEAPPLHDEIDLDTLLS